MKCEKSNKQRDKIVCNGWMQKVAEEFQRKNEREVDSERERESKRLENIAC